MAARKRRHIFVGADGDQEAGTVTYHYDVVWADDESDYPEVIRSYSNVVPCHSLTTTPVDPEGF